MKIVVCGCTVVVIKGDHFISTDPITIAVAHTVKLISVTL